jgi:PAS domain S-box-containing protein
MNLKKKDIQNNGEIYSAFHLYKSVDARWQEIIEIVRWNIQNHSRVLFVSNNASQFLDYFAAHRSSFEDEKGFQETLADFYQDNINWGTLLESLENCVDHVFGTLDKEEKEPLVIIFDVFEILYSTNNLDNWSSLFESIDKLCHKKSLFAFYLYDTRRFSIEEINIFREFHPYEFTKGRLHESSNDQFLSTRSFRKPVKSSSGKTANTKISKSLPIDYSDDYFRTLFELAPLPYQSLDIDGCILNVNAAWCEMLGYAREDVVGHWLGDYLVPAHRELFRERFAKFKQCGKVAGAYFEMLCRSGKSIIISVEGRIAYHQDGRFRQTHCILSNVTDQIQAEQARHEKEHIYQELFENNPEKLLLIDPATGAIVGANPAACKFYGYRLNELQEKKISEINILAEGEVLRQMAHAENMEKNVFHFHHLLANGEIKDVEVISRPIVIKEKTLLYSIIHDKTHERSVEEEAKRLNLAIRQKIIALAQPVQNTDYLKFEDLYNLDEIQEIQDAFAEATGVASVITDLNGNPITEPSNFCQLCKDVIRNNPSGMANCIKSDTGICRINRDFSKITPCLSAGLLDIGTGIFAGDHHIANWMIGQVWDPDADIEQMLKYADALGIDRVTYSEALKNVHRMPIEQLEKVSKSLFLIADQLSKLATQNIQQARTILERESVNQKLIRVNHMYRVISTFSQAAVKAQTPEDLFRLVCDVLVKEGKFEVAYIGFQNNYQNLVEITHYAGEQTDIAPGVEFSLDALYQDNNPLSEVIRGNQIITRNQIDAFKTSTGWEAWAGKRGYLSVAGFPVIFSGEVIGGLIVYSSNENFFDQEEIQLLQEISSTLTFSIDSMKSDDQRKKAEIALVESEKRYRCLFTSGSDAIYMYPLLENGQPGKFIEVNPIACERLGYSQEELCQLSPYQINPEEKSHEVDVRFEELVKKKHILIEAEHVSKSGNRIPVEINSSLFELNGRKYGLSISRDISERRMSEKKIKIQIQRLSALHIIDSGIISKLPLDVLVNIILEQVITQLDAKAVVISLFDPKSNRFTTSFSKGLKTTRLDFSLPEKLIQRIFSKSAPVRIDDLSSIQEIELSEHFDENPKSLCCIRIDSNNRILGVLQVFHDHEISEDYDWCSYATTLAGQTAIALETLNLDEKLVKANSVLVQAYEETIDGWAKALDLRDHETEGHSRRVTEATVRLSHSFGFTDEEITYIRRGALLHDIGKVGVPDSILLKPAKLTDEEWVIMKKHPQYSYDLLSSIEFLKPSIDIPYYHHEKWDGTGYPKGLKREEIPMAARIFAVVDVWDALRSDRPYRKGWSADETKKYILSQSGTHFDPKVVEIFLMMEEFTSPNPVDPFL